jgi:hypothetical protein
MAASKPDTNKHSTQNLNVQRIHLPRPARQSCNRVAFRAEEALLAFEECPGIKVDVELRRLFDMEDSKDDVDIQGSSIIVWDSHVHGLCVRLGISCLVLVQKEEEWFEDYLRVSPEQCSCRSVRCSPQLLS